MDRYPVVSQLIRSVGYDPASSILEVEFTDAGHGHIYLYYDVPYSTFEELLHADSKGRYFNELIRDLYASERLS